ncbi:MAG: LysM peptidoglycan-binding domain-containing M23 family metallopeptidase [Anaerolineales bacterium]|nr:LysM peptidoglycan-binding domain-containing M23 family metallopeptidase [Anaerolineales bacterium]
MTARSFRLLCFAIVSAAATVVCSSGYVTPGSLGETQQAEQAAAASATALQGLLIPVNPPTATEPVPTDVPTEVIATAAPTPTPALSPTAGAPFIYTAQSGDTLPALAVRFNVDPADIASPHDLPSLGLINPGQVLTIPNRMGATGPSEQIMPDSEVVYSPSSIGFNTASYVGRMGGHLAGYREYLPTSWHSGAAVVERVAYEHSLNPRLLLSVLQEQSNWVLGEPSARSQPDYPMGYIEPQYRGLYQQLSWAARQLSIAYYSWRDGRLTELTFRDGYVMRLAPELNAGTVAVQYLFSRLYDYPTWLEKMDPDFGFAFTHGKAMFPDPWLRAAEVEPLLPANPAQSEPNMSLPFFSNQIWYFTGGPHGAWEREGAQAALDFAPSSTEIGCAPSAAWVTAAAEGLVVRSERGVLVVDWDGDGNEQTGWVILYLHVTNKDHIRVGDWVNRGDRLGNPSCEGGTATGTHLHIARKYNGEWIAAGGPLPMRLSGWFAEAGPQPYEGRLLRGENEVVACTCSNLAARIARSPEDPY